MQIAHFSDLHLLSVAGARAREFANKRWIGAMNLLSNRARHYVADAFIDMIADLNEHRVDHLLCTGDITNLALDREFEYARGLFDRLAYEPSAITAMPGNHDAYVQEGIGHFDRAFGHFATSDEGWGSGWPTVRIRGDVALISLCTSRETPWFTAWGEVGEEQLARLAEILVDPRIQGRFRLVAIHHPPAGKWAHSKIRGLRDHVRFADVIHQCGAELIVHGHEHRDLTHELAGPAGPVTVLGVPSGTYAGSDPRRTARYRIFTFDGPRLIGHRMRVWQRAERSFVDDTKR